eukprot:7091647-Pyramimonas_sp.AAC.1
MFLIAIRSNFLRHLGPISGTRRTRCEARWLRSGATFYRQCRNTRSFLSSRAFSCAGNGEGAHDIPEARLARCENIPTLPASDWSTVRNIPTLTASDWSAARIYPRFLRLIGPS